MHLQFMNWVRHGGSTTFETKSSYCRVARLGFKRRATAVLKSNLIRSIEFGTAVARRLKRALNTRRWLLFVYLFVCLFVFLNCSSLRFFRVYLCCFYLICRQIFYFPMVRPFTGHLYQTALSLALIPLSWCPLGGHGPCNRFPLFDFVFRSITSLCTLGARGFFFSLIPELYQTVHTVISS